MYTVGPEKLGSEEFVAEALELMQETFEDFVCSFDGEVYEETDDPDKLRVIMYGGLVTSVCVEPPSFTLLCRNAELMLAPCDCEFPASDLDLLENFEVVMEATGIAMDCDELSGGEKPDPHYEDLPDRIGDEITVRFDHLGAYGVFGSARRK